MIYPYSKVLTSFECKEIIKISEPELLPLTVGGKTPYMIAEKEREHFFLIQQPQL